MWKPKKAHIPNFDAIAAAFTRDALVIADEQVKKFAEKECRGFIDRIKQQKFVAFGAIPLSRLYLARKRRYRRSLKTMVCTGTYLASIRVHVNAKLAAVRRVDKQYVIGIDPAVRAVDITGKIRRKVSLNDVARWNEFGAPRRLRNRPPARPHWSEYLPEMAKRAQAVRDNIARLAVAKYRATMRAARRKP